MVFLLRRKGAPFFSLLLVPAPPALREDQAAPEIDELDVAAAVDEDVLRLDVAVHDAARVRRAKDVDELAEVKARRREREARAFRAVRADALPPQSDLVEELAVFHHVQAHVQRVGVLEREAEPDDAGDVRAEIQRGALVAHESRLGVVAEDLALGHHLEGEHLARGAPARPQNLGEGAVAELAEDVEVREREGEPRRGRGGRGGRGRGRGRRRGTARAGGGRDRPPNARGRGGAGRPPRPPTRRRRSRRGRGGPRRATRRGCRASRGRRRSRTPAAATLARGGERSVGGDVLRRIEVTAGS